jgi:hypothetical protein
MVEENIQYDYHLGLIMIYPELNENNSKMFRDGIIVLQNDSDGKGTYVKEWNYSKPQPTDEEIRDASVSENAKKYTEEQKAKFEAYIEWLNSKPNTF